MPGNISQKLSTPEEHTFLMKGKAQCAIVEILLQSISDLQASAFVPVQS